MDNEDKKVDIQEPLITNINETKTNLFESTDDLN